MHYGILLTRAKIVAIVRTKIQLMLGKTTRKLIDIDFKRVSIACALVRLTKTENV